MVDTNQSHILLQPRNLKEASFCPNSSHTCAWRVEEGITLDPCPSIGKSTTPILFCVCWGALKFVSIITPFNPSSCFSMRHENLPVRLKDWKSCQPTCCGSLSTRWL